MGSLQEFSLINNKVKEIAEDFEMSTLSNAFYFFALELILQLQKDEIEDAITDNFYLQSSNKGGHDRGIDVLYIDREGKNTTEIHMFNFKYMSKFEKIDSHFPSNEIEKILLFLQNLLSKQIEPKEINPILYDKVQEIWQIYDSEQPKLFLHFCSNLSNSFQKDEQLRLEKEISNYDDVEIKYYTLSDFVDLLHLGNRQKVDAKLRATEGTFFEKNDGDVRALIVNLDARDLVRIVLDDPEMRNNPDADFKFSDYLIFEEAFENNVRIYLKQRSKINRSIKATVLSHQDNYLFFYFNNGITITCDKFVYQRRVRFPIIELSNLQIVNGSQTIHALYDAFLEGNIDDFKEIDVLCRIYETSNIELSTKIAEYTNSQNPVKNRDIRSIDYVQQNLEKDFETLGYHYDRKRNQHTGKRNRIDAEKVGQVLLAFYNGKPSEAKNKKSSIFADEYENIFHDEITARKILLPYQLFERIEDEKKRVKEEWGSNEDNNPRRYIPYISYYILYFLSQLADKHKVEKIYENLDEIWNLYDITIKIIEYIIKQEKNGDAEYTHMEFFRGNKPKRYLDDLDNIIKKI